MNAQDPYIMRGFRNQLGELVLQSPFYRIILGKNCYELGVDLFLNLYYNIFIRLGIGPNQ